MQNNPYKAPEGAIGDDPIVQGSPIKGTLIGLLVILVSFFLILNVPSIYFGIHTARHWTKEHGINGQEFATLMLGTKFAIVRIVFALLAGSISSFVGGYIFAQIARRSNFRLAFVLSGISAISIYLIHGSRDYTLSYDYKSYDSHAALMQILVTVLTSAGVLLGAKFYKFRMQRRLNVK